MNDGARPRSPVTAGVVLGVAVGVFGVSFGVLASASGLSVAKACALSLLVFTGASQFAAVSVVGRGGSSVAAIGSALLLAARNGVYGLTMAPILGRGRGRRLVASQLVIDESTAMATAQPDVPSARRAFWATGLAIYVCWNVGTVIGAAGGGAIGHPETLGLDAAFPAGFLALVVPHLKRMDGRRAAVVGGGVSLVFIPFVPVGVPILVAVVGALVGLRGVVSWAAIAVLAACSYGFKFVGLVVIGSRPLPARFARCLALLPAALLPALVVVNTVGAGRSIVLDARLPGVMAAGLAVWRKAPFPVVIVVGAAVTALVRHV